MSLPSTRRLVLAAAAAAEDKKAEDLRILELDPVDSGLADYFIICSALSDRQAVAIADEIEYRLKHEFGVYANSVEGRKVGEWILLDYIDFVVHVFVRDRREFYDIERLRKTARSVSSGEIEALLKPARPPRRDKKTIAAAKTIELAAKKSAKPAAKKAAVKPAKSAPAKKTAAKKIVAAKPKPIVVKAVKPAAKKLAKPAAKKTAKPAAKKSAAIKKAAAKKSAKKTGKSK